MTESRITLKDGTTIEVNLSATQLKRLRRAKKGFVVEAERGKEFVVNAARIRDITPL